MRCGKWRGIYGDAQQLSVVRAGMGEAERRKRRGGTETRMHMGLAREGLESTTESTCCLADTGEPQAACEQRYVTTESMFLKELPPKPGRGVLNIFAVGCSITDSNPPSQPRS